MNDGTYLIWSNEHQAWWGPDHKGYVKAKSRAGRYSLAEATEICVGANKHRDDRFPPNEAIVPLRRCVE